MLADLSICLFTIDDELDSGSPSTFAEDLYAECLPWWPAAQAAEPLRRGVRMILRDVEDFLRKRPAFGALGSLWHREGEATLRAMWQEAIWREREATLDMGTYLSVAVESITTSWMAVTLMILTPRDWDSDQIAEAVEAARAVSLAIRLANDIRSYEREKSEGKVGAVAVLARAGMQTGMEEKLAEVRAQAAVRTLLDDAVSQALGRLGLEAETSSLMRDQPAIEQSLFPAQVGMLSTGPATTASSMQFELGLLRLLIGVLGYLEKGDFPRAVTLSEGGLP